jgi:hypothetical protein
MHCGGLPWSFHVECWQSVGGGDLRILGAAHSVAVVGWLRYRSRRGRLRVVNGGCCDKKTLGWCWRQVGKRGSTRARSCCTAHSSAHLQARKASSCASLLWRSCGGGLRVLLLTLQLRLIQPAEAQQPRTKQTSTDGVADPY